MDESKDANQYLTFLLKNEYYGVPIGSVREINQYSTFTRVPQAPEFVLGVINLRGKIIPVIDLRLKFAMEKADVTKETCIVVIETDAGEVGVVVDAVREVVNFTENQIEHNPNLGVKLEPGLIKGMGKADDRLYILVDLAVVLGKEASIHTVEMNLKNVA